jgi:hypothetical protein|tara:strand:+ start:2305 stop:2742 length:438 start_codon:yes stop_codon:yes gene_type:complete
MEDNQENYYDLRNNNDDNINVLIDYLTEIHPDYMKGDTKLRHNYNPEPQDKEAIERFAIYNIHLENLSFDKIMNEFQRQDENKHLTLSRKNKIQDILTGYLSKKQREERDKRKEKKQQSLKRSLGGKKKSKRKNSKKRNTKKNKK